MRTGFPRIARYTGFMLTVSEEEVLRDARKYLSLAESGEVVIVTRGGQVVARIQREVENSAPADDAEPAYQYTGPLVDGLRPAGLCKGQVFVAEDFDAPLPDELLDAFEGREDSA